MAPVATIATHAAASIAARFNRSDGAPARWPSASSTLTPTKAPTEMNAPWPKLMTSISPKTSVRPEAMMKIIIPIASPDTVSVNHEDCEGINRNPQRTRTGTSTNGVARPARSAQPGRCIVGA